MAEQAEANGISVPMLSAETQRELHEILPAHLGVSNPVDNGSLYRVGTEAERRRVFELIGADGSVDVLVCALTGLLPGITDDFAADILAYREASELPVVVTWNTWEMDAPAYRALVESGVPIFRSFRGCFRALAAYFEHRRGAELRRGRPPFEAPAAVVNGRTPRTLAADEASSLLRRHGIPIAPERFVASAAEAAEAAAELGPRVVLKALLPEFPHKSDVGLVRTGIASGDEAAAAFGELQARSRELVPGLERVPILVQQQAEPGVEVLVGVTYDETLGPAIAVGLGGVFTEVLGDVSVRPLPVLRGDVEQMLRELRGYPLLQGVRGGPPSDVDALVDLVVRVADLAADPRNAVYELDLNPVIVTESGAVAVDSLVIAADGGPA